MSTDTLNAPAIIVTKSAQLKITDLLAEENNPNIFLRIFVQGGGCAGFQYGFTFDDNKSEDDVELNVPGIKLVVDSMSAVYLQGATVDYKEELRGSYFSILNPNASTTCGCGSSFSV